MDVTELTVETAPEHEVVDAEHVLESTVEVYQTYAQRYDAENNQIITTKPTTETKSDAYTEYECSCGETFFNQTEALEHLRNNTTTRD